MFFRKFSVKIIRKYVLSKVPDKTFCQKFPTKDFIKSSWQHFLSKVSNKTFYQKFLRTLFVKSFRQNFCQKFPTKHFIKSSWQNFLSKVSDKIFVKCSWQNFLSKVSNKTFYQKFLTKHFLKSFRQNFCQKFPTKFLSKVSDKILGKNMWILPAKVREKFRRQQFWHESTENFSMKNYIKNSTDKIFTIFLPFWIFIFIWLSCVLIDILWLNRINLHFLFWQLKHFADFPCFLKIHLIQAVWKHLLPQSGIFFPEGISRQLENKQL